MTNTRTIIGLDIGGTKTVVVEGTYDAEILQRVQRPTHADNSFHETIPSLSDAIEQTIERASEAGRFVSAISVSIGGPLRIAEGILENPPHLPGWHGVHLKSELERRFPNLPVRVEHDGNAGAVAEYRFGIGRDWTGLQHLVFLTMGTGLGAGIIVNGQLLRGANELAGEVGHIRLSYNGPIGYGKAGSWEGFCSGAGMLQLAKQIFPSRWNHESSITDLIQSMVEDDKEALAVAYEAGIWLGKGLALLIDMLNPQAIVLGSLAVVLGERLLAPARHTLRIEALPQALTACRIEPATLGKNIGDVASLIAVINDPDLNVPDTFVSKSR